MKRREIVSEGDHWMTPAETVEYLRLGSISALYRLVRGHRLPYGRVGRKYRFSKARIDSWVEVRGVPEKGDV